MPGWLQAESRPNKKAIIAWEVYGRNGSVFSSHEIVHALQGLRQKKVVEMFVRGSSVWWKLKD